MPVQFALTVYVPGMDSWRTTSPLKLAEMTAFTLPLPSYFSIPAMANGAWSFPVTSTPSWAIRYVPCSVALEHFALAEFSFSANPLPTASTPTRPTTPTTTNKAATYLFMSSVPPCFIGPHVTAAAYSCERGGRITQLQYFLQLSLRTPENPHSTRLGESLWSGFIADSFGPPTMPRGKGYWRHEEDQSGSNYRG